MANDDEGYKFGASSWLMQIFIFRRSCDHHHHVTGGWWMGMSLHHHHVTGGWWMGMSLQACGLILITLLLMQFFMKRPKYSRKKLPPGPINLPIIGAFLSVGFTKRHLAFFKLSNKYGPLLYMKLGGADVVVANNAETAKLVLKVHDAEFSGRHEQEREQERYEFLTLTLESCPYNARFRRIRKVINSELLCQKKLNEMGFLRREELLFLVGNVAADCLGGNAFKVRCLVDDTVTNIICRMIFGRLYPKSGKLVKAVRNLKTVRRDFVEIEKKVNIADMIPQLARFDLQRIEADFMRVENTFGSVLDSIVHEHTNNPVSQTETKDFIDYLLEYDEGGDTFSEPAIKAILNDLIIGAIDPVALSVEWTLVELLRHPLKLLKAQKEIDARVGHDRTLEESDLDNLPYIQAIVKESLRLYPVAYLVHPHVNEHEVELAGFTIPAHSNVYINLYGIANDPNYWKNADEFQPERFLGSDINMSGTHFQFVPFSSGRRRCPALLFSSITVPHMLAVLLHTFEWRLPDSMSPKDIVTEGRHGEANDKLEPLIVCAESRLVAQNYKQF